MHSPLHMWAAAAAEDPSRAHIIARHIEALVRARLEHGADEPEGYLYAGAHNWIVESDQMPVEALPNEANPNRTPITSSVNQWRPMTVPFDALILGVAGWAAPSWVPSTPQEEPDRTDIQIVNSVSCAVDGRDLFSVELGLDGQVGFGTDGDNRLMLPASVVVGTRTRPRPLAWRVQRQQQIQVRFRNIANVYLEHVDVIAQPTVSATVCFYALSLGMP